MIRTQIYLDTLQHKKLKQEARERDISLAQLMREIVDRHYASGSDRKRFTKADYMSIVGIVDSGRSDVAENHDDLIGKAMSDDRFK